MIEPAQCVVLVPVHSAIEPGCEVGLRELERRGYAVQRVRGYSAIDQARSQLATDALREGPGKREQGPGDSLGSVSPFPVPVSPSVLATMWIDSDIGFSPDDVDRLREHDLPICGGIYPQKGRKALATHVLPGTEKVVFGAKGGLIEVLYSAAGFLYVKREVYETIQRQLNLPVCNAHFGRPLVPYFQPLVADASEISPAPPLPGSPAPPLPWYLPEDFSFCHRARQCGYKIMADTRIRLRHFGTYGYMWEDAGSDLPRYGTYHFGVEGEGS